MQQRHDPHPSLQLRLQPLGLPPLNAIDHSGVRKAANAAESMASKFREAQERLYALEQRRPEVEADDRKALGDAMRRGDADPGDAALQELDAKIASARREAEAAYLAAEGARRDLGEAIERARPGWLGKREAAVDDARKAIGAAVDELARACDRLAEERAAVAWLTNYPTGRYSPVGSHLPQLRGTNGDPYNVEPVLQALRALSEPPAPPAAPPEPRPLQAPAQAWAS